MSFLITLYPEVVAHQMISVITKVSFLIRYKLFGKFYLSAEQITKVSFLMSGIPPVQRCTGQGCFSFASTAGFNRKTREKAIEKQIYRFFRKKLVLFGDAILAD